MTVCNEFDDRWLPLLLLLFALRFVFEWLLLVTLDSDALLDSESSDILFRCDFFWADGVYGLPSTTSCKRFWNFLSSVCNFSIFWPFPITVLDWVRVPQRVCSVRTPVSSSLGRPYRCVHRNKQIFILIHKPNTQCMRLWSSKQWLIWEGKWRAFEWRCLYWQPFPEGIECGFDRFWPEFAFRLWFGGRSA